ncbi:MAG: 16S rRNA (uracil(1498)-N(3))-methyltransferase, partial [Acetatifactor sp.]|nr:16S rRNA (uracil(1498)-N(3))-methyltransferase [Acetatifactor sp.]
MYHFFVEPEQIHADDKSVIILGADVNHIKNVLRMKVGEEISVSNGQDDCEYRCGIVEFGEESIRCELRFVKEDSVELPVKVTLFQGLPKGDKMELIVQKA